MLPVPAFWEKSETALDAALMLYLLHEAPVEDQNMETILYMIENNLRDATLVGLLTGTGVGFLFDYYFKAFRYDAAGLIVLLIAILVIVLELTSNRIRRAIA